MSDEGRLVVKHLLLAEIRIVFRLAGRDIEFGDADVCVIDDLNLEFIAIEIVAGRDGPADFEGRGVQTVDGDLKGLLGVEDTCTRSTAKSVEQPTGGRFGQERQQYR